MERRQSASLLSPSQIGDVNRSRVLRALCDYGPQSRADLAKITGVTRATIGNIVQALIESHLVEEYTPAQGSGRVGKPARPVWFGPRAGTSAAMSVSPADVQVGLVNARGDLLDHDTFAIDGASITGRELGERAARAIKRMVGDTDILGVGVAFPGVCDTANGAVMGSGQLPGVEGATLVAALEKRLGESVILDNDSRAQAQGELWFGDGRGVSSFLSVQTGEGLGVGIVVDGTPFRGRRGLSGELGHTCVHADGAACRCGLRGCWETIATLRWLRTEARSLGIAESSKLTAARLVSLAHPAADELLDRYADNVAVGLATAAQMFGPERIILHGDVVGGGEALRARIDAAFRQRSLANVRDDVSIVLSQLDDRAALLGAAGLVLSDTFALAS